MALILAPALALLATVAPQAAQPIRLRRDLVAMGTSLAVTVEAGERETALAASEAVVRAVEEVERRLSTWRDDSELARLNRSAAGAWVVLSDALARELTWVEQHHLATRGAFDPAVGGLVDAWDLRGSGRRPTPSEIDAARIEGGLAAALERRDRRARRLDPRLRLEEGGFGKGIALGAALDAARASGARFVLVDLGGQLAVEGGSTRVELADPRDRSRSVVAFELARGSIATSGNSERGITVGGVRLGHLLDPRTGAPARDFGTLAVWSADATAADCLSTGLYVLGPDAAFDWARERTDIEVVALEVAGERLRVRATPRIARTLVVIADDADFVPEPRPIHEGGAADARPSSPGASPP